MRKAEKKNLIHLSTALVLTILSMTIFSIPIISIVAPLGDILFPGTGLWRAPGEVPTYEEVYIPGLSNSVNVYRDEWGVPHIYGDTMEDVVHAAGYVHAQDRLFQMDMLRRMVRGKLSEVVGDSFLESDKYNLAVGMEHWAQQTLEAMYEWDQNGEFDYLDAFIKYVDGVNLFINAHSNEWPIEYSILGFKPTEWTLLDSLCFFKYLQFGLTFESYDLDRMINLFGLGSSNYTELFTSTYGQVPIVPEYGSYNDSSALPYESGVPLKSSAIIEAVKKFMTDVQNIPSQKEMKELQDLSVIGSNNWVVDGNKSSTGKPILCNDMHLQWMMPGIWYEAHLVVRNLNMNIYGFTLAGIPLVIAGHNDHLAWGFTNTGYDVIDWYYYISVNSTHYIYDGTITEYETRTHTLKVKDAGCHTFTVKETVHGPVLSDFFDDSDIPSNMTSYVIAPRWTANNISLIVKASVGMNMAKNWLEFNESAANWDTPAQNIVYADVKGNISIRPTGLVPIRDDTGIPSWHTGNGSLPYNGSNGEGEWIGYVPFQELPYSLNPQQGYLVSANQIAVGPEYTKYHLQNNWATGYRARRINELLNNSPDGMVGIEMMKDIQLDIKSTAARAFVPYFINATLNFFGATMPTVISDMITQLYAWDYDMDKDLAAPTIYRKWRDYYYDYTFDDEFNFFATSRKPAINVLEQLTRDNASSLWFNDITTATPEDRDIIIIKALNATSEDLVDFYGNSDVYTWRWGDIHKLAFLHLIPQLESLSIGPFDGDGSGYTVTPSGVNIRNGVGEAHGGASERLIVDLSDMKNSISVIPSGQRGISNSEHYSDQLEELFLQGKYHRHYFYNESSEFPTSHIESQILFTNIKDMTTFYQMNQILIIGSLVGVICIIGVWGIKKGDVIGKLKKRGGAR